MKDGNKSEARSVKRLNRKTSPHCAGVLKSYTPTVRLNQMYASFPGVGITWCGWSKEQEALNLVYGSSGEALAKNSLCRKVVSWVRNNFSR